jgi:epoxyqueuosine reductase QueG
MKRDETLTNDLKDFCKKIGINLVGFAEPLHFDRYPELNRPSHYLKNAKTVIIIGIHIYDIILDAWHNNPEGKKNFHFADSILENYCNRVKEFLSNNDFNSEIFPYKPGLYLKDAAALAGIGPIGKNNLLLTEVYGSQIRLRALATDAALLIGNPINESKYCKECNICQESCPANAFSDGIYNKDLCLSYNLLNLKKLSDYTVIWCNVCIDSCPIGNK